MEEIRGLSFPDANVLQFSLENGMLLFVCDSFYTDLIGHKHSKIKFFASNYKNLQIIRFDSKGSSSRALDGNDAGRLKDICECNIGEKHLKLAGFETESGQWQIYELEFDSLSATY